MGAGRWSDKDWASYSSTHTTGKSYDETVNTKHIHAEFDPKTIKLRESRDSVDNPESTAVIVAGDVTGSMGQIAYHLLQEGLNTLATEIYARRPVTDPHLLFMAVGDMTCDRSPLQVTQFEADIRIAEQLQKLFVEGGGGGNDFESYHAPWLFAALKTSIDCWEQRGKKGVLITYGDEQTPGPLTVDQANRFLGIALERDLTAEEVLAMVQRTYDVYHLMIMEGSHARSRPDAVRQSWTSLLGESARPVDDYKKVPEIIVSILQVRSGADKTAVAGSWGGDTSVVVAKALDGLTPAHTPTPGAIVSL